jgi:hypothetical protein
MLVENMVPCCLLHADEMPLRIVDLGDDFVLSDASTVSLACDEIVPDDFDEWPEDISRALGMSP